ncbi:MAG TPA: folylpolyglutamate synthase/dihydrofolate synthase family protein [Chthoniobacterales bacterium]|nr:folylpolyglutamate synthase/dihydrofolate synthase family protein [Chthoniobacterales bacterium]
MGGASAPRPSSAYREALAWLYGTQRFGIKLGLDNVQRLLLELNLPGKDQRIIHVAGTNGKGSVCAMIDSICRAQGYRTGLFTSPHLVSYRERIRVGGEMIGEQEVAEGLEAIRQQIAGWDPHPTFFEITTALALDHFQKRYCELVVLETGLGGRLDATNALTPVVSVITPIGYDHQAWLGNTLEEIAAEKAGIIKARIPVVSAKQEPAAEKVIRARAVECEAPLEFVTESYSTSALSLAGAHQKQNAAVAIAVLRSGEIAIDEDAIVRGLASVQWPARFQRWDERIIIDGAHNPAGAQVLAETWRAEFGDERATIILAVLREKDVAGILRALAPIARRVILPRARTERAVPPGEVAQMVSDITPTLQHSIAQSLSAALDSARATPDRILLTGSLHFAGEVLALLEGNPDALEDCAQ